MGKSCLNTAKTDLTKYATHIIVGDILDITKIKSVIITINKRKDSILGIEEFKEWSVKLSGYVDHISLCFVDNLTKGRKDLKIICTHGIITGFGYVTYWSIDDNFIEFSMVGDGAIIEE